MYYYFIGPALFIVSRFVGPVKCLDLFLLPHLRLGNTDA